MKNVFEQWSDMIFKKAEAETLLPVEEELQ